MVKSQAERGEFAKVGLTLRMPEWLRAQIDEAATRRDRSINEEINRRLEDSLRADQRFAYERAVIGDPQVARTMRALGTAIDGIRDVFGPEWEKNRFAVHLRQQVIAGIVERLLAAVPADLADPAPLSEIEQAMLPSMAQQMAARALPLSLKEAQALQEQAAAASA